MGTNTVLQGMINILDSWLDNHGTGPPLLVV